MGIPVQILRSGGEMNFSTSLFIFTLLIIMCTGEGHYEDERCCPLKAVERESMSEMFALVERVPWSQVNNNCTSNCAYIKMKDLQEKMDEMQNATNASEGQVGMENI